jgi:ATP-binding cassette, subfamily B, bacterial
MTPDSPLRRLLSSLLWAERRALFSAYLATLLGIGCVAIAPWPLQAIIDHVIGSKPLPTFFAGLHAHLTSAQLIVGLAGIAAAAAIVAALCGALEKNLNANVREGMTLKLRDRVIGHIQSLPLALSSSARTGELALRVVDDVQQVVRFVTKSVPQIIRHAVTTVALLAIMYSIDQRLCALGAMIVVVLGGITQYYARTLQRAAHDKRQQEGEVAGLAQEIMRGLPNIQSNAVSDHIRGSFKRLNVESLRAGLAENRVAVAMERTMQVANGLAMAAVTAAGALMILREALSVGQLMVFVSYMTQLMKPVEKINELASNTSRALVRATRLDELLAQVPLVTDPENPIPLVHPRGEITLTNVDFAYPATSEGHQAAALLRNLSIQFRPGQLYVIVGASGSGKTTLFRLLSRVFDPGAGELRFDGIPYRDLALRDLRQQFAIVHQSTHLFSGTLRDALVPIDVAVSAAEIVCALDLVCLTDFVNHLPAGLATEISEDGLNLSGGQRTRIAIARAMLGQCPVLLFDEPLANIDVASQQAIVAAIKALAATRTCIVVSHQASITVHADQVLELRERTLTAIPAQIVLARGGLSA